MFVIGISGGTGSGKSALARRICRHYGASANLLSMDRFYKDRPDLTAEERKRLNYDSPDALDAGLFRSVTETLRRGGSARVPDYDFSVHRRKETWEEMPPRPILVLEGILLFACPETVTLPDLRIFIETPEKERLERRLRRDVRERGRTEDSVRRQFRETVAPMHDKWVEPSRKEADIVAHGGAWDPAAWKKILERIPSAAETFL